MTFQYVPIGAVFDIKNGATPSSGNEEYWDGDVAWVTRVLYRRRLEAGFIASFSAAGDWGSFIVTVNCLFHRRP